MRLNNIFEVIWDSYNSYDIIFFFKQKTAYEMIWWLEFRRVLFRSQLKLRVDRIELQLVQTVTWLNEAELMIQILKSEIEELKTRFKDGLNVEGNNS